MSPLYQPVGILQRFPKMGMIYQNIMKYQMRKANSMILQVIPLPPKQETKTKWLFTFDQDCTYLAFLYGSYDSWLMVLCSTVDMKKRKSPTYRLLAVQVGACH
jgi:hypothetical protein